jgi:hypothetical protein
MENKTSKKIYAIAGSNLQICFVNEHHQANESLDSDMVRKFCLISFDLLCFFVKTSVNLKTKDEEDILTKQKRLKVKSNEYVCE